MSETESAAVLAARYLGDGVPVQRKERKIPALAESSFPFHDGDDGAVARDESVRAALGQHGERLDVCERVRQSAAQRATYVYLRVAAFERELRRGVRVGHVLYRIKADDFARVRHAAVRIEIAQRDVGDHADLLEIARASVRGYDEVVLALCDVQGRTLARADDVTDTTSFHTPIIQKIASKVKPNA